LFPRKKKAHVREGFRFRAVGRAQMFPETFTESQRDSDHFAHSQLVQSCLFLSREIRDEAYGKGFFGSCLQYRKRQSDKQARSCHSDGARVIANRKLNIPAPPPDRVSSR